MTRSTSYRRVAAAVTVLGLFAAVVTAQPPRPGTPADPLKNAELQKSIAQQKAEREAEADVRLALENASKLAGVGKKPEAARGLNNAIQNLQFKTGISDATRTQLTAQLKAKLSALDGVAGGTTTPANPLTPPGFKLDPKGADVKAANEIIAAKYLAENKDVRQGIERVADYQARGLTAQANAEIARLARAYPHNPSVLSLGQQESMRERLDNAQALYAEAASRWVKNQENIMKSAMPAIYDMEFPKDWAEKSKRRLSTYMIQLTDKEKKIVESLNKPTTVNFQDRPLEEALQDLSNLLDQPLLIDKKSLSDLELDLKRGVTLQAKGLTGRTVLRSILGANGLTFVIKDETIQIVTVEKAKAMLTTRVYPLADLINAGPFSDPRFGPVVNFQQAQANAEMLIELIKKIDPLSWNGEAGGPGSITYHAPTQSIIVRNSAEVHHSLSSALSGNKK